MATENEDADKDFEEAKDKVIQWIQNLEKERKCNITSAVCKLVKKLKDEKQIEISTIIAEQILKLTDVEKNESTVKKFCIVVNGCFDNFPIAVKALDLIIVAVFNFISDCLKLCKRHFRDASLFNVSRIEACEIVRSLSRLGTLILKLRRLDSEQNKLENENNDLLIELFTDASKTCTMLICYCDAVSVDTKINLGMMLWLMKEIAVSNQQRMIELLDEFSENLEQVGDTSFLIFIMASAAANLYTTPYINAAELMKYLTFFVSVCQRYSNETSLLLTASRSLQVVTRHQSFLPASLSLATDIATVVFMLLEHPVACVRHSGRDLLQLVILRKTLCDIVETEVMKMPSDRKCFFIGLAALGGIQDTRRIVDGYVSINKTLMTDIVDTSVTSDVCYAIERLALNDSLVKTDFTEWCNVWVEPLLAILPTCVALVAGDIEKLLSTFFHKHPEAIQVTLQNLEGKEYRLHGVLFCLKVHNSLKKEGNQFSQSDLNCHLKGLKNASMYHSVDDVRLLSLSLVTEGQTLEQAELDIVLDSLPHNLNNHRPCTRQKLLVIYKKFLTRINSNYIINRRRLKKSINVPNLSNLYESFIRNLVNMCYSNIFAGANFNRMNTVLNIMLMCKQILDNDLKEKTGLHSANRWPTLMVALSSTFDENKELAVQLASALPFSTMYLNEPIKLVLELRKAFGLVQELEPPNTLLGCANLRILIDVPIAHQVLLQHFSDGVETPSSEVHVLCIQILARRLSLQVDDAKMSKLIAVKQAPMYGTMYTIRQILPLIPADSLTNVETVSILRELVELSVDMTDAVTSVVNNSSPEGHLPMDLQQLITDDECERTRAFFIEKGPEELTLDLNTSIDHYKRVYLPEGKHFYAKRIVKKLEKEVEMQAIHDAGLPFLCSHVNGWIDKMAQTKQQLAEFDCYEKFFAGQLPRINEEPRVTAQALLLYSWRTMKEASLYLGDLVSKLPLKEALEQGLLTEELVTRIGLKLRQLLLDIKHRGAFENVDVGFSAVCMALWQCPLPSLHGLPNQWLRETLEEILKLPQERTHKLTVTRRSAGLPLLVQTIVTTQLSSNYSTTGAALANALHVVLTVAEKCDLESRLHALNIIRALFKHAPLGKFIISDLSKALKIAIRGSRSLTWSERNCSNLVFSAIVPRIFGVLRSRDNLSRKNKLTCRVFFQRYPSLYEFLLDEMLSTANDENNESGVKPQPSLYLILLLLSRLYPPETEDNESVDLTPFVRQMAHCAKNPIMSIRVLAARALVPFVPINSIPQQLQWRLNILKRKRNVKHNIVHGLLLQVVALLHELKDSGLFTKEVHEMEIPTWMLPNQSDELEYPPPISQAAVQLMKILVRHYPNHPCNPIQTVLQSNNWLLYTYSSKKRYIGADACLAELAALQLECIVKDAREKMQEVLFLKECGVTVVEDVLLQFVYCAFTPPNERNADFDFSLTEGLVDSMTCLSTKESLQDVQNLIVELLLASGPFPNEKINNLQQRRLRVLNSGYLLMNLIEKNKEWSKILNLIGIYGSFWESDGIVRVMSEEYNATVNHITDQVVGRIVTAVVSLMEGDKTCRLAAANLYFTATTTFFKTETLETYKDNLLAGGVEYRRFWLCLFQLLADEDEDIQMLARKAVALLSENLIDVGELSASAMTSLWCQHSLLQCFLKLMANGDERENLLLMALLTIKPVTEETTSTTMELFKRGDPNPFCEPLALTRLFTFNAKKIKKKRQMKKMFPGGESTHDHLHTQLSPHFANYGLRLTRFATPVQLVTELARLEQPDNANVDEFWWQVKEILSLFPRLCKQQAVV